MLTAKQAASLWGQLVCHANLDMSNQNRAGPHALHAWRDPSRCALSRFSLPCGRVRSLGTVVAVDRALSMAVALRSPLSLCSLGCAFARYQVYQVRRRGAWERRGSPEQCRRSACSAQSLWCAAQQRQARVHTMRPFFGRKRISKCQRHERMLCLSSRNPAEYRQCRDARN